MMPKFTNLNRCTKTKDYIQKLLTELNSICDCKIKDETTKAFRDGGIVYLKKVLEQMKENEEYIDWEMRISNKDRIDNKPGAY